MHASFQHFEGFLLICALWLYFDGFGFGFVRLGFLIDFLSHAAIVGFMGGAAITIALQQLKGFLGIQKFTKNSDIISVMKSVWGSVNHGVRSLFSLSLSSFVFFLVPVSHLLKRIYNNTKSKVKINFKPRYWILYHTFCSGTGRLYLSERAF